MTEIDKKYIYEFWRSHEPRICYFCQIFLHSLTKCITLKSNFVNNLSLAIVRIPLVFICFEVRLKTATAWWTKSFGRGLTTKWRLLSHL